MVLSHLDDAGRPRMVDVGDKPMSRRLAKAEGFIALQVATVALIRKNRVAKGNVLLTAELAGVQAAKQTPFLVPLCHPIALSHVVVRAALAAGGVRVESEVRCTGQTGAEMEALTAVSAALLTVYDMCKAVDSGMRILGIKLTEKRKEVLFRLLSINISRKTGTVKKPVARARFLKGRGIEGDAHARGGPRQVSLLAQEDIDSMAGKGLALRPGDFGENLVTRGIELAALPAGARLSLGEVILEISRIGKTCRRRCAIYRETGDCIMPRRGVFARVVRGGEIENGCTGSYRV